MEIQPLFLTLSYDETNIPIYPDNGKRDVQLFMKRLRRHNEEMKIRFFACNELGDKNERLHVHMFLFGFNKYFNHPFKRNDYFASLWQKGFVKVENCDHKKFGYVCDYLNQPKMPDENYFYILSSRKPGIGASYLTESMIKYLSDRFDGKTFFHSKELVLPTFLRKKVFSTDDLQIINKKLKEDFSKLDNYTTLCELEDVLFEEILTRYENKTERAISLEYDNNRSLLTEYFKVVNNIITSRNDFTVKYFKKLKKHDKSYEAIEKYVNDEFVAKSFLFFKKPIESPVVFSDSPLYDPSTFELVRNYHEYCQNPYKYYLKGHPELLHVDKKYINFIKTKFNE